MNLAPNTPTFTSHSGLTMPQIGLGTYKLNGREGVASMVQAAKVGYRELDSAFNYENEGAVGKAVRQIVDEGIAKRSDIIVASKLPGRRHEHDQALYTVEESLYRMGLEHIDLYLIHWPNPVADKYVGAWRALIQAKENGLIKHIGVCNFAVEHLERLRTETGVLPEVNQIELHPYFPQEELLAYGADNGIITQAWSPLARMGAMVSEPVITEAAAAHGVTPVQVVLRWHTQRGAMPIPKSSSAQRQRENLDVFGFSLSDDEIAAITGLGRADGRMKGQDPTVYEEF